MSLQLPVPFHTTDWSEITATAHAGETGMAYWKTWQWGSLRMRVVEYTAGYKADHWCSKGHLLYCLEGELSTLLRDGSTFVLKKGMSYQVSDNQSEHLSSTDTGATLLIVDGSFLNL